MHLFSVLVIQQASFMQSTSLYHAEILLSPEQTTKRGQKGSNKQGTERVVVGQQSGQEARAKEVLSLCSCLLLYVLFSGTISHFLRNACLCGSQLHLCFVIMLLFKRRDGRGHVGERKISKAKHTEAGLGQNVFLQSF